MKEISDSQQRQRALDPLQSFAVIAPAGSGKTELLTKRVLTLLAQVQRPEEIMAITFTRKAANEMRQRIVQALQTAQQDPPNEPHKVELWQLAKAVLEQDQQQQWRLLQNPNRLRLQTIDSFCMALVRQMPIMSGIGGEAAIADEPDHLYRQAARNLLRRLEEKDDLSRDLADLLAHLDNDTARIETLFCHILAKREQWLRHLVGNRSDLDSFKIYLESCLQNLIEETLTQAAAKLKPWQAPLVEMIRFAAAHLSASADSGQFNGLRFDIKSLPDTMISDLPQWRAIVELLLTKSGSWRARLTKNEGFPAANNASEKEIFSPAKANALALIAALAENPQCLPYLLEIRALPSPQYDQKQWQLLGRLANLLPLLVAELLLIFREEAVVDYQQISIAAAHALGHSDAPTDIALLLDYQLKHILVDEFQDTSSAQFALLAHLTEGWQQGDGRTFFIVGDGMQSCYGFRDANVGLFLAARQFGIGNAKLEPLELTLNFRSRRAVVDWVNQTFRSAFPSQDDIARGAVRYSPSAAYASEYQHEAVAFYACIDDPLRQTEAEKVVDLIQQTRQAAPLDSIAILVRNRSHLQSIIPQLHHAGIDWLGVDIEPLAQRAVISDLLALTKALLNLIDRVSWLAVLRAPWCGLSLTDLEIIGGRDGGASCLWEILNTDAIIDQLSAQARPRVRHLRRVIQTALEQRARKPLRYWIEGIWLMLAGPATANSSDDLVQVDTYFQLLEQHEAGGIIADMSLFEAAVARIYAQPGENANAVQIMTIHKAKGLEFDHVIVPGLERTGQTQKGALILWHERLSLTGEAQLLISPISPKGEDDDPLYRYLKQEQALKDRLENTRLLYVAATRAIKRLSLIACVRHNAETDELSQPAADSLLSCIWSEVQQQAIRINPANEQELDASPAIKPEFRLCRLAGAWRMPELAAGQLLKAYRGHEYQDSTVNDLAAPQQKCIEAMIKKILLSIAKQGLESWRQTKFQELPEIIDRLGLTSDAILNPESKETVIAAVTKTLADKSGCWLLASDHKDRFIDRRIGSRHRDKVYPLSIPLTFVTNGERWVIEFLVSTDQDAFIEAQSQLQRYAQAMTQLDSLPVKKALYFPLLQKLLL